MIELAERFRSEAPNVRVTDTTLMWGAPYYTKLAMACAGGRAPDLATMHASRLATFGRDLLGEWDLEELTARGVSREELDGVLVTVPPARRADATPGRRAGRGRYVDMHRPCGSTGTSATTDTVDDHVPQTAAATCGATAVGPSLPDRSAA